MSRKCIHTKVTGGALQYTLFIAVIIALLIFAFINLTAVQQKLKLKSQFYIETIETTHDQFANLSSLSLTDLIDKNSGIQSQRKITPWGIYTIQTISTRRNKEFFRKSALIASQQIKRPALYMADENNPLVVVGNTKIQGDAWLPKAGIKPGSIGGKPFRGTQLVYGNKLISKKVLPELSNLTNYGDLTELVFNANEDQMITMRSNHVQSFDAPTLIYRGESQLHLKHINLTGNMIIQASQKITVHESAILRDLILLAPEIEILAGVIGNFQAFSTKTITLNEGCTLEYPSALVLETTKNANHKSQEIKQINISNGATIKGVVAFLGNEINNWDAQILIDTKSQVFGEIYCQKNVELKGSVYGSVYTNGFIAHEFGTTYLNHIYNGQILSNELSEAYVGLAFENTKPEVAKWIYY